MNEKSNPYEHITQILQVILYLLSAVYKLILQETFFNRNSKSYVFVFSSNLFEKLESMDTALQKIF